MQQEMGGCENDPTADRALQQQVAVFVCSFLNCLDGYGQVQISLFEGNVWTTTIKQLQAGGFQICKRIYRLLAALTRDFIFLTKV